MSESFGDALSGPEGILTLLGLRGVGPQAVAQLSERFRRVAEVVDAKNELLEGAVTGQGRASLRDGHALEVARSQAVKQLERAHALGISVVTPMEAGYPEWLRLLKDRPPVLYVRGQVRSGRRYVACIGTREPSQFGVTATTGVTKALVSDGWSVVSGLAVGVDALAHRACLDAGGHTVAVLANGLDTVYPKANAKLAREIVERGGALISEQPFGAPAIPRNLVQRDRLQCGMSAGTVVNQTDVKGGSMHTVRFTLMQGRKLFAPVPTGEHALEAKSQGILALTSRSAQTLVELLGLEPTSEYALLLKRLGERVAATGLRSRDDYPRMLEELGAFASSGPRREPAQMGLGLGHSR